MSDLTLAIMAAGMGSRYGGMKQLDRFGENGEILMEYGIYDALKAGFSRVVIIIKEETLNDFKQVAGDRLSKHVKLDYAFQRKTDVPGWFKIPETRVKPWGTAHAAMALEGIVNEPFCIINADDFYGAESYKLVADFLANSSNESPYKCCLVGYRAENVLSENGAVTRGVCDVEGTKLIRLVERHKILRRADGIIIDEDSDTRIPEGTSMSMNMFGLQAQLPVIFKDRFDAWLRETDIEKGEYLLPNEISNIMNENLITVDVLPTSEKWHGVTYQEDKEPLVKAIRDLIAEGKYPDQLWK